MTAFLQDGLGLTSTNRVVIRYTFSLHRDRLVERIRGLQFFCRLQSLVYERNNRYVTIPH